MNMIPHYHEREESASIYLIPTDEEWRAACSLF